MPSSSCTKRLPSCSRSSPRRTALTSLSLPASAPPPPSPAAASPTRSASVLRRTVRWVCTPVATSASPGTSLASTTMARARSCISCHCVPPSPAPPAAPPT
uniref:Id1 n=1 Tax=Arundo donax TaxID=35708 RepID=A0A0A9F9X4_ARUDO